MSNNKTINIQGSKQKELIKSKGYKCRLTMIVGVASNGVIFPPLFTFKSKLKIQIYNKWNNEQIVAQNQNEQSTRIIYLSYLKFVISNLCSNQDIKQQIILTHDKFSGQKGDSIINWANKQNIKIFLISEGARFLIQVIDTNLGKKFKDHIRKFQQQWLQNQVLPNIANIQEQSQEINLCTFQEIKQWCLQSLREFDSKYLIQGFRHCGLNLSLDLPLQSQLNQQLISVESIQKGLSDCIENQDNQYPYYENEQFRQQISNFNFQNAFESDESVTSLIKNNFVEEINELNEQQQDISNLEVNNKIEENLSEGDEGDTESEEDGIKVQSIILPNKKIQMVSTNRY